MISHVLRIYRGSTLTEINVAEKQVFSIGSKKTCDISLEMQTTVKFIKTGQDWTFTADTPILLNGKHLNAGTINPGEMLVPDAGERFALTILPSLLPYEQKVGLSGLQKLSIGRAGADYDIEISNKQVTAKHAHATLTLKNGNWYLCDSGSANGTYLNGRLTQEAALSPGDTIDIAMCRIIFNETELAIRSYDAVAFNLPDESSKECVTDVNDDYPYGFRRSPRLKQEVPYEEIEIGSPPSIGTAPTINWLAVLLPSASMAVISLIGIGFMGPASLALTVPGILVTLVNYNSQRKKHAGTLKMRNEKYGAYLSGIEAEVEGKINEQRKKLCAANPSVEACISMAQNLSRELWDRTPCDKDFMTLRVGSGSVPSCVTVKSQKQTFSLESDSLAEAGAKIADKYRLVNDCPITFDILRNPTGGIIGDRSAAITLAQCLIVHAAAHHCYDELKIIVVCHKSELDSWRGTRFIPHVFDDDRCERYIASEPSEITALLNKFEDVIAQRIRELAAVESSQQRLQLPFLLFVFADAGATEKHGIMRCLTRNDPKLGIGAILLYNDLARLPKECSVIIDVSSGTGTIYGRDNSDTKEHFRMDMITSATLDRFARFMAPIRVENLSEDGKLPTSVTFLEGYGLRRPEELNLAELWDNSRSHKSLAVPIAARANGEPFLFNILWGGGTGHHGPHGLVAGTTRSGKSEMVQSWILSMSIRFSPQEVSFVLIDWKGTSLIFPFRNLPHIAGTISNIDTDARKKFISLEQELLRRQVLFDANGVTDIKAYMRKVQGNAPSPGRRQNLCSRTCVYTGGRRRDLRAGSIVLERRAL